jgi:hypothetical protein
MDNTVSENSEINQRNQKIAHIEAIRTDLRDEVKRRIEQRDAYSIALATASGGAVAVALSNPDFRPAFAAIPLFFLFFTHLLHYSYRVHNRIVRFLRTEIEPELANLCETPRWVEWENYYAKLGVLDIRGRFFSIVQLISILILIVPALVGDTYWYIYITIAIIYLLIGVVYSIVFWSEWNYSPIEAKILIGSADVKGSKKGSIITISESTKGPKYLHLKAGLWPSRRNDFLVQYFAYEKSDGKKDFELGRAEIKLANDLLVIACTDNEFRVLQGLAEGVGYYQKEKREEPPLT